MRLFIAIAVMLALSACAVTDSARGRYYLLNESYAAMTEAVVKYGEACAVKPVDDGCWQKVIIAQLIDQQVQKAFDAADAAFDTGSDPVGQGAAVDKVAAEVAAFEPIAKEMGYVKND